ncbi:unnamed protein product [Didymodactylos carnosus]|uniref:Uncharacterized protein n=1 Tax=Didymodactylos carnosus TaxID=1234261 RepID=A0A8S2VA10_9BILA|nr:unnamed protein product [Didymodactylos carnosus]CAF4387989.1 unnamed protein product [Didymodactylos carnosus]
MHVGGDNYMDNPIVLSQFERIFKLLPFKNEYKKHRFVFLVDNARTHTAAEHTVNDFAMYPDGRCPVDNIDFLDENNIKQTIECYDNQGISKGLLALAHELNLSIPNKCKLPQLKTIVAEHSAFKNVSKLEKLAAEYNVKIMFTPKHHCETNPIEGY